MKKVFLAATFLLLLYTGDILAADDLTSQAVIGLSNLKSILDHNPHPSITSRSGHATSLIYYYSAHNKQNTLRREESQANAIELEFDEHEILSAIKLIHFDPTLKN
jgi:hypothetical protein